jgi:hemin uptake protein HemP
MDVPSLGSFPSPTDDFIPVPAPSAAAVCPRWISRDLLGRERVAIIVHEGVEYRLQLTRQNKLLLTK